MGRWLRETRHENTELRQSETRQSVTALRKSEKRLRTIIANMPLVLFALDCEGVFTLSEGKGLEALGLRAGKLVGLSVFEVYREVPQLLEDVRRALAADERVTDCRCDGALIESQVWNSTVILLGCVPKAVSNNRFLALMRSLKPYEASIVG
jgi:PAS domain S-box-containing protein